MIETVIVNFLTISVCSSISPNQLIALTKLQMPKVPPLPNIEVLTNLSTEPLQMLYDYPTAVLYAWERLRVKTALIDGYFNMPLTLDELLTSDYQSPLEFEIIEKDDDLNVDVYSHVQDPRLCLLYDTFGNIAGVRFSVSVRNFETKRFLI
ncbi:uncharacterized protein LOC124355047 [Homalodisca vitripennis]|uniref:uncharacterized protein LOC124355047 n=1 Tax=Homalodisca vitripennis TaxID=197043 RepID=UPI001EEB0884|nr:uncharacterized protein LOC124355047 [Homalodisca vitripennis]